MTQQGVHITWAISLRHLIFVFCNLLIDTCASVGPTVILLCRERRQHGLLLVTPTNHMRQPNCAFFLFVSFVCLGLGFFCSSYCTDPWLSPEAALSPVLVQHTTLHALRCPVCSSCTQTRPWVLSDFSCLQAAQ